VLFDALRLALLRLALRLCFRVILNLTRFVLEPPNKLENQPFFSSSAVAGSTVAGSTVAVTVTVSGAAVTVSGAVAGSSILSTELSAVVSPSPPRCFL
jgi:hypothetical protein